MNTAILPDTDPRAKQGVDRVTTAVINSGCFLCCLAVLSMISLVTESVSHACHACHASLLACNACINLF